MPPKWALFQTSIEGKGEHESARRKGQQPDTIGTGLIIAELAKGQKKYYEA